MASCGSIDVAFTGHSNNFTIKVAAFHCFVRLFVVMAAGFVHGYSVPTKRLRNVGGGVPRMGCRGWEMGVEAEEHRIV